MNNLKPNNMALDTNMVLKNYGGETENNIIKIFNLNDEESLCKVYPSLYYELDGLTKLIKFHSQKLCILNLNIQSLNSKFDEFSNIIKLIAASAKPIDIISLQETWLSDNNLENNLYNIPGYKMISMGCHSECSIHGGLLFYIRESLCTGILKITKLNNFSSWEGLILKIKIENKVFNIFNVYRPPSTQHRQINLFLEEYLNELHNLQSKKNEIIVLGDFNINLLHLEKSIKLYEFFDLMISLHFLPKITFPTRITDTSATLIDQIFCKQSDIMTKTFSGIFLSAISDHYPTFTLIDTKTKIKPPPPKFLKIQTALNDNNVNAFINELKNMDLLNKLTSDNPDNNYNILIDNLTLLKNKHFPFKTIKFNKHKHKLNKWITKGILTSIQNRDKLYKTMRSLQSNENTFNNIKSIFLNYNKILKKVIRISKQHYYNDEFQKFKSNTRKTWETIKTIFNSKNNQELSPVIVSQSNQKLTNRLDQANEFNNYFVNIGKMAASQLNDSNKKHFESYLKARPEIKFNFTHVSPKNVIDAIKQINSSNSCGYDEISSKMIKLCSNEISKPLCKIINQSFDNGIFPNKLKISKVIPLLKNNDKDVDILTNYRPISLLPCLSKVFEKIVHNQLYTYLQSNQLIYKHQYGFRPNHSTELAALELTNKLQNYLSQHLNPIAIFLDLSKAFDSISHDILLKKMTFYGIHDKELAWFSSYLSNRKQFVSIDNTFSTYLPIQTGVPQGSVLGPLLFLLYVNDLHNSTSVDVLMYADDTCLIIPLSFKPKQNFSQQMSETINQQLSLLNDWLIVNKLNLNASKSKYMLFHHYQKYIAPETIPVVKLNNDNFSFVKTFKFLGLFLDSNLSWNFHVNEISNKVSKICGALSKLKYYLPLFTLRLLYNSLILPHLSYSILNWGFNNCNRLKILQKRAIRHISLSKCYSHTNPLFKSLNLLSLDDLFTHSCLKFLFKSSNNLLPSYFHNFPKYPRTNNTIPKREKYHPSYLTDFIVSIPYVSPKNIKDYLPLLIKNFPSEILSKIYTHSLHTFSLTCKRKFIDKYWETCTDKNCYICNKT